MLQFPGLLQTTWLHRKCHRSPLRQEHFGATDYVLLLDHRAFVNVQAVLQLLDGLPETRVIQGCLLEESIFTNKALRKYLHRRRAGVFPHGMGFILSTDVAKFLSDLAKDHVLKQAETAVDVAVGFWLGLLEGLRYVHSEHFQPMGSTSRRGLAGLSQQDMRRCVQEEGGKGL